MVGVKFDAPQVGQEICAVPLATGPFAPLTLIGSIEVIERLLVVGTFRVLVFVPESKLQVNYPVQRYLAKNGGPVLPVKFP